MSVRSKKKYLSKHDREREILDQLENQSVASFSGKK